MREEAAQQRGELSPRQRARLADMSLLLDVVLKTNTLRFVGPEEGGEGPVGREGGVMLRTKTHRCVFWGVGRDR